MTDAACRVLIADDHAVVRDGLRLVLEQLGWVEVVGAVSTAEHAVRGAVELHPDVVLMDLAMPECGGIEATRRIGAAAPWARVLVLSSHRADAGIRAALDAGAAGYVTKTSALGELADALRAVHDAGAAYSSDVAALLAGREPDRGRPLPVLTDRELAVLEMLASGASNHEIARRSHLSEKTVANTCTRIYLKLGVRRRTEAAAVAHRHGVGG